MIERARLLEQEYDPDDDRDPKSLTHAISFPEVRSLDLLCKGTLERFLPGHRELAEKWHVNANVGLGSPNELHSQLVAKRAVLRHAVDLAEARRQPTSEPEGSEPEKSEAGRPPERAERHRPTLLGHIGFVPRGLATVADIGGALALVILVVGWLTDLF